LQSYKVITFDAVRILDILIHYQCQQKFGSSNWLWLVLEIITIIIIFVIYFL